MYYQVLSYIPKLSTGIQQLTTVFWEALGDDEV